MRTSSYFWLLTHVSLALGGISRYVAACFVKGLVINCGDGGATKWENRGCETFCAHDRVKLFVPSLLKSENFLRSPFKVARTNYSKTCCAPRPPPLPPYSAWLKHFLPPPLFIGLKPHMPPPSHFVAPLLVTIVTSPLIFTVFI